MTFLLDADGLGKRYGRQRVLTDCTVRIPAGHVVGLVGPNGAGKSTLLELAAGLIEPSEGSIRVLGEVPASSTRQLSQVGFVAQHAPVYRAFTVAEHLRLGAELNERWDSAFANSRIEQLGLDPQHRAGQLSGGQRALLALTMAVAKRPELLIFDEPVATLDPLARHGFLRNLMESVAELGASVILSSHVIEDLERVCDYLVVLSAGRIQLADDVADLTATHHRLVGGLDLRAGLPEGVEVIEEQRTSRQSTLLVRSAGPLPDGLPEAEHPDLENVILAYLNKATPIRRTEPAQPAAEVGR
ncbi:ABC transporter ATP-binding protein [Micromonospora robiginosa]|uniref:ABC transporter ATP-binding protein n=1 Tax=Micromonospora robiginosa TaxID=2749844 RepID=A0A7L6B3G0_9ACTN|nr:ABC transporter ATP-binding protein [Micromonospora ferruginea]QLQ36523.1 ABC transporter ATP-binding protein [Micromonospora ferruginea]